MANMVILYENFADLGTFFQGFGPSFPSGYGSWDDLLNLQDSDIRLVARSTTAANADSRFRIDLGVEQPVGGCAFGPVNMSPGSTWRLRAYSDAAYYLLLYDSGIQSVAGTVIDWSNTTAWLEWEDPGFWLGIADLTSDELPQYAFHIIPSSIALAARFWQLEIFDDVNSDGFLEIGRFMLARAFRPERNYGEDNSAGFDFLTDTNQALGGKRTYWERGLRRTWRGSFQHLSNTQMFRDVISLALRAGLSKQVFIVPDPDDVVFAQRRSFLATLKQSPAIQQLLMDRGSTSVDAEEVL